MRGGLHGAVAPICTLPGVSFMLGEAVIHGIAPIWCGGIAGFVTYGGFTFTSAVQWLIIHHTTNTPPGLFVLCFGLLRGE